MSPVIETNDRRTADEEEEDGVEVVIFYAVGNTMMRSV